MSEDGEAPVAKGPSLLAMILPPTPPTTADKCCCCQGSPGKVTNALPLPLKLTKEAQGHVNCRMPQAHLRKTKQQFGQKEVALVILVPVDRRWTVWPETSSPRCTFHPWLISRRGPQVKHQRLSRIEGIENEFLKMLFDLFCFCFFLSLESFERPAFNRIVIDLNVTSFVIELHLKCDVTKEIEIVCNKPWLIEAFKNFAQTLKIMKFSKRCNQLNF